MNISEAAQEMLEKLWLEIVEGKKGFVDGKKLGTIAVINELARTRCITKSGNRVRLTPKGRNESRKIIRRHRLAERLLHDVLGVGEDEMESAACKFEHIISEGVEESICTLLGHPKICPHGKSMPQGKCCRERKKIAERIVSSLSELKKGQHGKIVYILTKNHKNLQKLLAMGLLPGMTVEIIQRHPSHVFQIGQTQIAVDTNIANDIYVRII